MKAAVIHAFGELPRFEDFPEPTAGEGEVAVNVRAAALHPIVRARASGSTSGSANVFPLIAGIDGVGYLDDGTRVYFALARPPYGTMAERSVVPREMTFPLPDRLDDLTAAGVFNPAQSSWLVFTQAKLAQGDTVLILGATGVAGKLAVQIAKRLGAGKVIALGRNAQALSELPRPGADVTISLDQPDQEVIGADHRAGGAVWGLGFGAVPVAEQSWMARAMPANVEGGLALFVSALQGSLAAGSAAGGVIYDAKGPGGALGVAAAVAAAGSLTLLGRAGASISSPPAGSVDLARGQGREALAPSQGAIDGAGNSAQRTR